MLTIEQRDRLLTAQERRMQLRRRSHLAEIATRLKAPDYFQHAERHTRPRPVNLAQFVTFGQRRDGCDPYSDRRGLAA